jgi:hypothetical protein
MDNWTGLEIGLLLSSVVMYLLVVICFYDDRRLCMMIGTGCQWMQITCGT